MTISEWVDSFAKAANLSDRHTEMLLDALRVSAEAAENEALTGLHCSFCGRPRESVRYLVQGSYGACICDECAAESLRMVTEHITARAGL